MKRRVEAKGALFLFLLLCLFGLFALPASAEEEKGVTWEKTWEEMPDLVKDAFSGVPSEDTLKEALGFSHLFSLIAAGFTQEAEGLFPSLLRLFGLTLLFAVAGSFGEEKNGVLSMLTAAFSVFTFDILWGSVARVASFLEDIGKLSVSFSPLFVGVFASGGAEGTAMVAGGGFAAFLSVLEGLCTGVLLPLLRVLISLSIVSSLGKSSFIGELSATLRGVYLFMLSLVGALLSASLALQSHFASAADTVATRALRFAVGSALPVVGGTVSSALGSLTASLDYIKSGLGVTTVLALLLLLLPVLAELFLLRFGLSFSASVAGMMEAGFLSALLSRLRALYDLMLATVAIVALIFLLLSGILAGTALPLQ